MKQRTLFIYVAYVWTKTLLGLTFHPFRYVRDVVRRPVLLPVLFSPFLGLFLLFIAGRLATLLVSVYGLKRDAIAVLLGGVLISVTFWQILLIYLLLSFLVALGKKEA